MNSDQNTASGVKLSTGDSMNDLRLRAARKRLAQSNDEEDAIEGLREIVANLLGSEEVGLFRMDRANLTFHLSWSFGVDLENYDLLRALGDAGLQRVLRGESHLDLDACNRGTMAKAKAFVPIRVANQTVGILAILRLLPQKLAFDGFDMELFKLLSDEAAKPLFGPAAHSKSKTEEPGMTA